MARIENVIVHGHEYTADEIMRLPERALSMGGSNESRAKVDADRGVAFMIGTSGNLILDGNRQPQYMILRKRGQTRKATNIESDDMLAAIRDIRKQMTKNNGKTKDSATGVFNPTFILIGAAITIVPAIALLFFILH